MRNSTSVVNDVIKNNPTICEGKIQAVEYGFVEEGRVCGCTSLLAQEFVIKMY
jgi:hypothetical protein